MIIIIKELLNEAPIINYLIINRREKSKWNSYLRLKKVKYLLFINLECVIIIIIIIRWYIGNG